MDKPLLASQSKVWTVRADISITECVRILRDRAVGALIVLSDDAKEEIIGIFTERDLVKNFALIRSGGFWDTPVRTVMTANIQVITVAQLHEAPRIMADHNIRHLPVVAIEKGKKRLVGVISMRDIFRYVMEECDYDLNKVYRAPEPKAGRKKVVAVLSSDPAIMNLVDKGGKLTKHLLVKAVSTGTNFDNLSELMERFDSVFIDLDDLKALDRAKVLAVAKTVGKDSLLFLAFSPANLDAKALEELNRISSRKRVRLLSKPIALGILYEHFLRDV